MCHVCGAIVGHHLDEPDPLPFINGHMVAPTIPRSLIDPARHPQEAEAVPPAQSRNMSPRARQLRKIKAHNHRVRERAIRQQRGGR